ncbi:MAG: hypothetical protein ACREUF_14540 [Solimonas sp.]
MVDGQPKARGESPRDMLWLLMAGFAVILFAYAALGVAGEFAYRGMKRLLAHIV